MSKDTPVTCDWKPPADWRPYTRGNPGKGRVKQVGEDGAFYSRPRTAAEAARWGETLAREEAGGQVTVARLAEGLGNHMQTKEKFIAVMDIASFSDKAAQNLIGWLAEWRGRAS